jgi:AAA ATPase domain
MDEHTNPFAPGAGTRPPELAGRDDTLNRAKVTMQRVQIGRSAKSFIFVGLRGVGKTVLLNEVLRIAASLDCKTLHVEAHENKSLPELLIPHLRTLLLDLDRLGKASQATKRGLLALRSFIGGLKLKYEGMEIGIDMNAAKGLADSGDLETDLTALFLAVGEAAKARNLAVVMTIDELQYLSETELSAVIMALHQIAQKGLPVLVFGAGLPQIIGQMGQSKSYAERLFEFSVLGPLEDADAIAALQEPVARDGVLFDTAALAEIIRVTEGYPYFLQEWGYQAWNIAPASPIGIAPAREATIRATRRLDESFFRVRFDRLTPREKDYLRAMAELGPGPHRSGDMAEKLGVRVESIAPLRSGLIRKGMIYSPSHGDTAFTVPLFDQYMKRAVPEMPKAKSRKAS